MNEHTTTFTKGDRVKATSKTTDETYEFEVHQSYYDQWLFSTSGLYFYSTSWDFELLKREHTFAPGTVIRFGLDPSLYIRNLDGTWTQVYIGYGTTHPNHAVSKSGVTDKSLGESIERQKTTGIGATVVYEGGVRA